MARGLLRQVSGAEALLWGGVQGRGLPVGTPGMFLTSGGWGSKIDGMNDKSPVKMTMGWTLLGICGPCGKKVPIVVTTRRMPSEYPLHEPNGRLAEQGRWWSVCEACGK